MPGPLADHSDSHGAGLAGCRWLAFDAVGTLIDPDPPAAAIYHTVGEEFGSRFSHVEVQQRFRAAFAASESDGFPGGPEPAFRWRTDDAIEAARWRWIVQQVLSDVVDIERCFQALWDHFANPRSWRCFDEVGPSLVQLQSAGYHLAVASNFDRRLHSVCDALPELKPIERRVISAEVGARKPARQYYDQLVAACGCDPGQILMIGDHVQNDVLAPASAGLMSIHLDREAAAGGTGRLASLQELVACLAQTQTPDSRADEHVVLT